MPIFLTKRLALSLACLQAFFLASTLSATADVSNGGSKSKILKGGVKKEGEKEVNPGLKRTDIVDPNADPFAGDEKPEEIEAPKEMMKMDPVRTPDHPPPPKNPLSGQVEDQGRGNMQPMVPKGNPFGGDEEPMPNFEQPPEPQHQGQVQSQDPDETPEMQLLWDQWHHRVAEAIYTRFNFFAKMGFKHSPPLLCQVSYVVTRDGHIRNLQVQQKSRNILFNLVVFQSVKSLDGDANLLQFPPNSRRSFVPKVGTFTQNYGGDGFKYTTGDRETIQGQRGR